MVRVITDHQEFKRLFPIGSVFWTIYWHDTNGPVGLLGPFEVLSILEDGSRNGPKVFVRNDTGQRQTLYIWALTNNLHGVCATKADAQHHLEEKQRQWRTTPFHNLTKQPHDDSDQLSQG